ncbi:MAG: hypothetical protein ACF8PN_15455 [Phycisphaerales bacterium]
MNVPPTAPLVHFTIENPWPLAIGLALVGFGVYRWGLTRGSRTRISGAIIFLAAVALLPLARFIESSREQLIRVTRSLVDAAVNGDSDQFGAFLSDQVEITFGRDEIPGGRGELLALMVVIPSVIESNRIREIDAGVGENGIGEVAFAQTTGTRFGRPVPNEWRIRWRRDANNDWRVSELVWEEIYFNETPSRRYWPSGG